MESQREHRFLCVACDGMTPQELDVFLRVVPNSPQMVVKLGLGNIPLFGEKEIESLKRRGYKLFVDAKLHDIPSQVEKAVKLWSGLGADFLTLHLGGGVAMLKAAQEAAQGQRHQTQLLGVSVLTSLNAIDLKRLGFKIKPETLVQKWIELGRKNGLGAFVCSGADLISLKKSMGERKFQNQFWVTPGIVFPGEKSSKDQRRVVDYKKALLSGAKMLVMGRALTSAQNPAQRMEQVLRDL